MRGTTNMNGVQEQGMPLPIDEYIVAIIDKTDAESFKGDPMVKITLQVIEGPCAGNKVWDNILIPAPESESAKILGRTKHFLHCIGEPYEGETVDWDSDSWVGKQCKIKVGHELPNNYHNYTKATVDAYLLIEDVVEDQGVSEQEMPL